jgi:hypothetical protein
VLFLCVFDIILQVKSVRAASKFEFEPFSFFVLFVSRQYNHQQKWFKLPKPTLIHLAYLNDFLSTSIKG